MTEGEKKKYEDLAYEENNQIKKCEQNVTNINNTSYDYTNVYKDVHVMIDSLNDKNGMYSFDCVFVGLSFTICQLIELSL